MRLSERLLAIKAKIDTPEKWTKGTLARDAKGHGVFANSPKAISWCLLGATCAVFNVEHCAYQWGLDQDSRDLKETLEALHAPGVRDVTQYNDNQYTTHLHIMGYLDSIIATVRHDEYTRDSAALTEASRAALELDKRRVGTE